MIKQLTSNTPIFGFRRWNIDTKNKVLLSAGLLGKGAWQPERNLAFGCEEHSSPGSDCHCGFNAFYELEDSENSGYEGILGAVSGAGKIELHAEGFRSEEAQIIALYAEEDTPIGRLDDYRKIAEKYSVPLFTNRNLFLDFVNKIATKSGFSLDELKETANLETKKNLPTNGHAPVGVIPASHYYNTRGSKSNTRKSYRVELSIKQILFIIFFAFVSLGTILFCLYNIQEALALDSNEGSFQNIFIHLIWSVLGGGIFWFSFIIPQAYSKDLEKVFPRYHRLILFAGITFIAILLIPTTEFSFNVSSERAQAKQEQIPLANIALEEYRFYDKHNRFTNSLAALGIDDLADKEINLEVANEGKSFFASTQGKLTNWALSGTPKEITTACSKNKIVCDQGIFYLDALNSRLVEESDQISSTARLKIASGFNNPKGCLPDNAFHRVLDGKAKEEYIQYLDPSNTFVVNKKIIC